MQQDVRLPKPKETEVELAFDREDVERVFSEYLSKQAGFPVKVRLDYDGVDLMPIAAIKDLEQYTNEQINKIRKAVCCEYECNISDTLNDQYDIAYNLVVAVFGKGVSRIWCTDHDGNFRVHITYPLDHYLSEIRPMIEGGTAVA